MTPQAKPKHRKPFEVYLPYKKKTILCYSESHKKQALDSDAWLETIHRNCDAIIAKHEYRTTGPWWRRLYYKIFYLED